VVVQKFAMEERGGRGNFHIITEHEKAEQCCQRYENKRARASHFFFLVFGVYLCFEIFDFICFI